MWIFKERELWIKQFLNSTYYIMDMAKVQTLKKIWYRYDTCNISKLTQTERNKEKNNPDWTLPLLKPLFFMLGTRCSCNGIPFDSLAPPRRLTFSHGSTHPFTICSTLSSVCFVSFSISHWIHFASFRVIHLHHVFLLSTL